MLGNFSFGDYFKKEAIDFAWELITKRLRPPQGEALRHGLSGRRRAERAVAEVAGVPKNRIFRLDEKDNFWQMGRPARADRAPKSITISDGGRPGDPDDPGERFLEIWNLVFMQFDRDGHGH